MFFWTYGQMLSLEEAESYFKLQLRLEIYGYDEDNQFQNQEVLIPLTECEPDRLSGFLSQLQYTENQQIALCPDRNFSILLRGNLATTYAQYLMLNLQQCNQTVLDLKYPGKNKKCKSDEEFTRDIDAIQMETDILKEYFDEQDFDKPIKNYLFNELHSMSDKQFTSKFYKFIPQNVYLKDSIISSSLFTQNTTFLDLQQTSYD
eukprot:403352088